MTDPPAYACNTCQGLFSTFDKLKSHYESDWHIFNAKRRAHNLAPLSKGEFRKRSNSIPVAMNKTLSPISTVFGLATAATALSEYPRTGRLKSSPNHSDVNADEYADSTELRSIKNDIMNTNRQSKSELIEKQGEHEDDEFISTNATDSIFDDRSFESVEGCLKYMRDTYGFFIPDRHCLVDLSGLMEYLNEKVKLGGYCLYCQKQFKSGKACQQHMIDKSHCKIAYEEDVDIHEFEDFYDYELEPDLVFLDENGERTGRVATITDTEDLILPSGKVVGHRNFRLYYKQKYSPIDERAEIIANKREELLRLGYSAGQGGAKYNEDKVSAMNDLKVMELLVKAHKAQRRENMLQQRAKAKDEMKAKRIDQAIKASKLKSNEQRTQIIRDYHGRLQ